MCVRVGWRVLASLEITRVVQNSVEFSRSASGMIFRTINILNIANVCVYISYICCTLVAAQRMSRAKIEQGTGVAVNGNLLWFLMRLNWLHFSLKVSGYTHTYTYICIYIYIGMLECMGQCCNNSCCTSCEYMLLTFFPY